VQAAQAKREKEKNWGSVLNRGQGIPDVIRERGRNWYKCKTVKKKRRSRGNVLERKKKGGPKVREDWSTVEIMEKLTLADFVVADEMRRGCLGWNSGSWEGGFYP